MIGGSPSLNIGTTYREKRIAILYENYFLAGDLRLARDVRTTDFLDANAKDKRFQTLYKVQLCSFDARRPLAEATPLSTFDFVTVNLATVLGIVELDSQVDTEHRYANLAEGNRISFTDYQHGQKRTLQGYINKQLRKGAYTVRSDKGEIFIVEAELIETVHEELNLEEKKPLKQRSPREQQ